MWVGVLLHWSAMAQNPVDHWEAVVQDGATWNYLLPTSQPLPYWMFTNFAATGWSEGVSGFGYGDGDDATVIPPSNSIYLRHVFQVNDANTFPAAMLAVDYDDGFVAYLNGTEIARGNAGEPGEVLAWDAILDGWHEAVLYAGGTPDLIDVNPSLLESGTNVLAVEVHNNNISSSDFTARPFLFLGAAEAGNTFDATPAWFQAPAADSHFVTFNLNMVNENVSPEGRVFGGGRQLWVSWRLSHGGR